MESDSEIYQFGESLHQEVSVGLQDSDNYTFSEQQFTDLVMDYLVEYDVIEERNICDFLSPNSKLNAYSIDSENTNLDLFITLYHGDYIDNSIPEVNTAVLKKHFKLLKNFISFSINQKYLDLEESSRAYDLADKIFQSQQTLSNIRLFFLTDGITKKEQITDEPNADKYRITYHIWDIKRLYRLNSSGRDPDPILIDFYSDFKEPLYCLPMPVDNDIYCSYLSIIPGKLLSDIYEKYGPRLLERNVRAFLQLRGAINKGIRNTIINNPHMFLAYNNGISATAEEINIDKTSNQIPVIRTIKDLQIVNGAQTTATLHQTHIKDKTDLSGVFVQLKITVLKNPANIGEIVPKISEYANLQNKITGPDFTSNYLYHIRVQTLSKYIWAPAHGTQMETHWYYERVKGQYMDDKLRLKTANLQKIFLKQNPTNQRFTKTDLAKFENSWKQLPHIVSLGAEKNYRHFVLGIQPKEGEEIVPDSNYFKQLIGTAILFKTTDKIIINQKVAGYKANIVTYSIAMLSVILQSNLNFELTWKSQTLSPELCKLLEKITTFVRIQIVNPPDGKNITEWCKKEKCWENLKNLIPGFLAEGENMDFPEKN